MSQHRSAATRKVELHYGATTDVGKVRSVNEDSYLAAPPVFVVADGMGGHEGGDVASRIVVEVFAELVDTEHDARSGAAAIAELLVRAQKEINQYALEQRLGGGREGAFRWYAGTTAVVGLLVGDDDGPKWLLANLGDSRIYRLDAGTLEQVSVDHSVVQELLEAGTITEDELETHPERHVVTRALGGPDNAEADYFLLPLTAVERLMLCSDGINGMIDDRAIEQILQEVGDPRDAADQLVAAALEAGGRDNATAVVVDVVGLLTDDARGSASEGVSLEQKLGALP
ncbi:PP2C family protein-serine/threonine phosphatase [Nocardioides bigeumensis]|uniref:Protein phosphatase 2C domain-containing protein n=1 Tax=Nocardioides bigeumensis TaxID=433657 RepID=A0ABN2YIF8_9ACTN